MLVVVRQSVLFALLAFDERRFYLRRVCHLEGEEERILFSVRHISVELRTEVSRSAWKYLVFNERLMHARVQ